MKLIPCIICDEQTESDNDKAIAKVCNKCNTGNLTTILKNVTHKKIKELTDKQIKLTKDGELI